MSFGLYPAILRGYSWLCARDVCGVEDLTSVLMQELPFTISGLKNLEMLSLVR